VSLTPIMVADLPHAVEAFITSSGREVMPVRQIDDAVIGAGEPGPVTKELMARYRAHVMKDAELP
jgi:branched-subunit amino acid aminotransferase/4-amino-4-deoxychorismate lyase